MSRVCDTEKNSKERLYLEFVRKPEWDVNLAQAKTRKAKKKKRMTLVKSLQQIGVEEQ